MGVERANLDDVKVAGTLCLDRIYTRWVCCSRHVPDRVEGAQVVFNGWQHYQWMGTVASFRIGPKSVEFHALLESNGLFFGLCYHVWWWWWSRIKYSKPISHQVYGRNWQCCGLMLLAVGCQKSYSSNAFLKC